MRSGIRIPGAMALAILATASMGLAQDASTGRVQPVPLGGALRAQRGDQYFGVYIPTRYGGTLTVKSSDGSIGSLTGPDGRPRTSGQEVGQNQQGWYTFKVTGAEGPYTVDTQFVQVGQAARMPWNYYYWPTKGDAVHEPWSGGNGRVDTPTPYNDDVQVRGYGSYIAPGEDIILPGPNGILETLPAARRHLDLVPQPVRRPDLARRRRNHLRDPVADAQV